MSRVHLANRKSFEAELNVSILDAARNAGIVLEHSCRTGRCGTCKARVAAGSFQSIGDDCSLNADERAAGWILTCTSAATGDLTLDIVDVSEVAAYPTRTVPCRVDALEHLSSDILKVRLRLPPSAKFRYLPGQYIDVIGRGGVRRSYSIANPSRASDTLELHVRRVASGSMSTYWFEQCAVNDLLRFEGPKGTFFLRDVSGMHLMFLATGTGIAPIKALLGELASRPATQRPRSTQVFWGGRRQEDIYWQPDTQDLKLDFFPVLSRAPNSWAGERGHVQDAALQRSVDLSQTAVYACGSTAMIESAFAAFMTAGLPTQQFFSDAFVSSS